jgi:hypothetical protein
MYVIQKRIYSARGWVLARPRPARFTGFVSFYPKNLLNTHSNLLMRHSALRIVRRGLATAAAHPPHASPSSSHVTASTSAIPLSNVEAQWAALNPTEQTAVHQQLEELQRKDWKMLLLVEKKAGTFLSFPGWMETDTTMKAATTMTLRDDNRDDNTATTP